MSTAIFLEYAGAFILLVMLARLFSVHHPLVSLSKLKDSPDSKQKKAFFYGLAGSLLLRFVFLFALSFVVSAWQVQVLGALYLLFTALHHLLGKNRQQETSDKPAKEKTDHGFWGTVLKTELADFSVAADFILAAVVIALMLPETRFSNVGEIDGGQFFFVFAGMLAGLVLTRFTMPLSANLLQKKTCLERAGFLMTGWVGVQLALYASSHPELSLLAPEFVDSLEWKLIFSTIFILIALGGWFFTKESQETHFQSAVEEKQGS